MTLGNHPSTANKRAGKDTGYRVYIYVTMDSRGASESSRGTIGISASALVGVIARCHQGVMRPDSRLNNQLDVLEDV